MYQLLKLHDGGTSIDTGLSREIQPNGLNFKCRWMGPEMKIPKKMSHYDQIVAHIFYSHLLCTFPSKTFDSDMIQ